MLFPWPQCSSCSQAGFCGAFNFVLLVLNGAAVASLVIEKRKFFSEVVCCKEYESCDTYCQLMSELLSRNFEICSVNNSRFFVTLRDFFRFVWGSNKEILAPEALLHVKAIHRGSLSDFTLCALQLRFLDWKICYVIWMFFRRLSIRLWSSNFLKT